MAKTSKNPKQEISFFLKNSRHYSLSYGPFLVLLQLWFFVIYPTIDIDTIVFFFIRTLKVSFAHLPNPGSSFKTFNTVTFIKFILPYSYAHRFQGSGCVQFWEAVGQSTTAALYLSYVRIWISLASVTHWLPWKVPGCLCP